MLLVDNSNLQLNGGGDVTLESGSQITGNGTDSPDTLENFDNTISGAGTIGDGSGALALTNDSGGTIDANVLGESLTLNTGSNTITNAGTIEAEHGGILTIDSDLSNSGQVQVITNGVVFIESNSVTNAVGGAITADGSNSAQIVIDCNSDGTVYDHGTFLNFGTVTSSNGGDINFDSATVTNEVGGTITSEADSSVFFGVIGNGDGTTTFGTLSNYGSITADSSYIGIESTTITNELGGTITADGATAEIDFNDRASGATLSNLGAIAATDGGLVKIDTSTVTNTGSFEATGGGELDIENSVTNTHGTLLAASGGLLDVQGAICGGAATIDNGTLEFGAKSDVDVTFHNSNGYGELILGDAADFSGKIFCFTGTDAGLSNSDEVFLTGVQERDGGLTANYCSTDNITTVTIDEQGGGSITLKFVGDYDANNFKVQQDANGLEIYDPPVGGGKQATVTTASADHTSAPTNQIAHVTDHATTSLSNLFGFGGNQDSTSGASASEATSHDNDLAAPADQQALGGKSVIAPLGAPALGGGLADGSFVNGVAGDAAGEAGAATADECQRLDPEPAVVSAQDVGGRHRRGRLVHRSRLRPWPGCDRAAARADGTEQRAHRGAGFGNHRLADRRVGVFRHHGQRQLRLPCEPRQHYGAEHGRPYQRGCPQQRSNQRAGARFDGTRVSPGFRLRRHPPGRRQSFRRCGSIPPDGVELHAAALI
jgi:hypothetical protein